MEAMVAGLPIIATDVGDNNFLVKNGFNGYLMPLGDIEEIALKLEVLVRSEELRKTFGSNSNILVTNDFNEEKLLTSYLGLLGKFTTAFSTS